jgi:transposase-like protein
MKRGKPITRPQASADARDSPGHGAKSDAVRERAILALLSEKSIGAAAQRCGVNERTLRRWLTDEPEFATAYDQARQATFTAGMSRVQALVGRAVETLEDLLGATKHPSVRLGAARTVAELALHQHDADVMLRRLDDIEHAMQERQS